MFRDLTSRTSLRSYLLTFLISSASLAVAGQAQAQPSDAANPAASPASTTTPKPTDKNKVILKVGDQQITEAQFEQYIADLEAQQGPADLSRKKLGENYSSLLALSQQAAATHLDQTPAVQRQLAIDRTQILSNAEFLRLKDKAEPTPAQIKSYYESHLDDYDVVKIRRVFILGAENPHDGQGLNRAQAKAMADAVKQAIANKKDVIATINAIPHSRTDVVADPDPLTFGRGELPAGMDKPAFDLKTEGEWAQIGDGPDEYLFIQLVKRSRKDLNEVSSQIEKKLQAEQLREELNSMKEKAGIWMDEAYFASKSPVPSPSTQPDASGQPKSGAERGER